MVRDDPFAMLRTSSDPCREAGQREAEGLSYVRPSQSGVAERAVDVSILVKSKVIVSMCREPDASGT
jgi:hypothetical protein